MNHLGFLKISTITPVIQVGNPIENAKSVIEMLNNSKSSLVLFPELTLSGYTASDYFFHEDFLNQVLKSIEYILDNHKFKGLFVIGAPLYINGALYNTAIVIKGKNILGVVPKQHIPNYHDFYEYRWFASGKNIELKVIDILGQQVPFGKMLFVEKNKNIKLGVEICEDLWAIHTPSDDLTLAGANIIMNLSTSTEFVGKTDKRLYTVLDHSRKQKNIYVYASSGTFESSSESVFAMHHMIASCGSLVVQNDSLEPKGIETVADISLSVIDYKRRQDSTFKSFMAESNLEYHKVYFELEESKDFVFDKPLVTKPFLYEENEFIDLKHLNDLLVFALVKKLSSLPKSLQKLVIGISGGLDSTLALLIADQAVKYLNLPKESLVLVTMPANATSKRSKSNAVSLIEKLNYDVKEINIASMVDEHLKVLEHEAKDVTYENTQARMRTMFLMNLANKYGGIVLGTGDLSEIALGWMTYNGDQMSMYAINAGVPKTVVQALVLYHAENNYKEIKDVLKNVYEMPISPELLENQKTEDNVGSYEINDFILYHHLDQGHDFIRLSLLVMKAFELNKEEANQYVDNFMKRFYSQQFKRQTLPEGPKVMSISLSPRGQFRLPSDINRKW